MAKKDDSVEVSHDELLATDTAEKNLADIIRGRMPAALVHHIRFTCEGKASELAKVYHTTPGKVADVLKSSNFKYITEDYVPTADDIAKSLVWADSMAERGDDTGAEDLRNVLNGLTAASDEVCAAQDAARIATRKPRGKKSEEVMETDEVAEAVDTSSDDGLDNLLDS